jgi:alcohol dehydrogenase (cytochrome c)
MLVTSLTIRSLDAQTGRAVWHHSRPITEGLIDDASRQHLSRRVGIWHNRLYRESDNAHLLCLDLRSGSLIWDVAYADWNSNYGATSAPLWWSKTRSLWGHPAGMMASAAHCRLRRRDRKLAWRFWTIPAPGEFGAKLAGRSLSTRRWHHLDAGDV